MIDTAHFPWHGVSKVWFTGIIKKMETIKVAQWWLCNTTCDLEPAAFSISPRFLPIGPLMETYNNNNIKASSSLWQEDTTCLQWLDQQPTRSVVYVSFGSLAVLESNQFKELALALDLINKPFLWVVRANDNNIINSKEFHGSKGKIVSWAPQKMILNHPAIACFVTHCGWNSTLEGVCGGVPFLCWPFNSDQFINKRYICDVWKVGLELEKDETGLISRGEIRKKVEQLLGNEEIRVRSLEWKEMTLKNVSHDGQSSKNLNMFVNWAK
ncbi:hypothetical protein PIB30_050724 [Stylosanthes scabra]|uniref:UDP-glycosyltransferase 83A1 n=1 Tax=Stylosanthes scabra TaxID=79078 RepID=A0ABU6YK59_9FABA|nr:hypothetical protein [Stylosanthes scabra]